MTGPRDSFADGLRRWLTPEQRDRAMDSLRATVERRERRREQERAAAREAAIQDDLARLFNPAHDANPDSHWLPMALHPSPETREKMVEHVYRIATTGKGDKTAAEFLQVLPHHLIARGLSIPDAMIAASRAFLAGEFDRAMGSQLDALDRGERILEAVERLHGMWGMSKTKALAVIADYLGKRPSVIRKALARHEQRSGLLFPWRREDETEQGPRSDPDTVAINDAMRKWGPPKG